MEFFDMTLFTTIFMAIVSAVVAISILKAAAYVVVSLLDKAFHHIAVKHFPNLINH